MTELPLDAESLIFIMRHGEAEPYRENDATRVLTALGRQQSRDTARWLDTHYLLGESIDLALVSPYTRARQTYDEVTSLCAVTANEIYAGITPEASVPVAADFIDTQLALSWQRMQPIRRLLLVSHMPMVSYLVAELCHQQQAPLFATAGVVVLRWQGAQQVKLVQQFHGY